MMNNELRAGKPGMKHHIIKIGSDKEIVCCDNAQLRFVGLEDYGFYDMILPFSMAVLDDGSILLLAAAQRNWQEGRPDAPKIQAFWTKSKDSGKTFSPLKEIPGAHCRPSGLVNLGNGELYFRCIQKENESFVCRNYFSEDYGETWHSRFVETPPDPTGRLAWTEGDPWVDRDTQTGKVVTWETLYDTSGGWPKKPTVSFIRRSVDKGLTFQYFIQPENWRKEEELDGMRYTRAVGEASLIRAANNHLVAALRTDIPVRFFKSLHDDSLCGLAVSISEDEGHSWSVPKVLYEAGRHHPSLVRLQDGRIVMSYVLRDEMEDGVLASYRRGCEAVISYDNGHTWDMERKYILDEFQYLQDDSYWVNGNCGHCCSVLAPDGMILTAYGNYNNRGCTLIKWYPQEEK